MSRQLLRNLIPLALAAGQIAESEVILDAIENYGDWKPDAERTPTAEPLPRRVQLAMDRLEDICYLAEDQPMGHIIVAHARIVQAFLQTFLREANREENQI